MGGKNDGGRGGDARRRMALAAAALGLSVGLVVDGVALTGQALAAGADKPGAAYEQLAMNAINQGKIEGVKQGKVTGANQGKFINQGKLQPGANQGKLAPGASQGKWDKR